MLRMQPGARKAKEKKGIETVTGGHIQAENFTLLGLQPKKQRERTEIVHAP